MLVVYPAIFHKAIEGGYIVCFPDLDDGATEGSSLEDAMRMAEDYIGTWLYDDFVNQREFPKASDINDISLDIDEEFAEGLEIGKSFKTLVSLDILKYVEECKNQVVRKNVSIPSWLNEMAKNYNINFSQVLQEGLKQKLEIDY